MTKTLLNIVLLLFMTVPLVHFGQGDWRLYDTSNSGIGDNYVEDIVIDKQGVVWIAGWSKLSRFNGEDWEVFEISNHINDLDLMNSGNLLLATSSGLFEFDTDTYELYDDLNSNIPFDFLECVSVDDNDNIWIGYSIANHRIAYYNGTNWIDHSSNVQSSSFTVYSIDCFENHVWAGIGKVLHHFDGSSWEKFDEWNSPMPGGGLTREIKCDSTGKVWVGQSSGIISENTGRLLTFDQNNWTTLDSSDCDYIWNGVTSIAFLDSTYWFCSDWRGFVYDDLSTYHKFDENNTIIPTHYTKVVAIDDRNNVFMGTEEGLVVYNENQIDIDAYKYEDLFVCYPVPVTNILNISFILQNSEIVKIELFNTNGSVVSKSYKKFEAGKNKHELNVLNTVRGVYYVRLSYGNKSEVKKIVKMN